MGTIKVIGKKDDFSLLFSANLMYVSNSELNLLKKKERISNDDIQNMIENLAEIFLDVITHVVVPCVDMYGMYK